MGESIQDYDVVRAVGIAVWTSGLLAAAFAIVLVRFRLVPGLVLLGFVVLGVSPLVVSEASSTYPLTVGFVAAGVAIEASVLAFGRPTLGRLGASAMGAAAGAATWIGTFAALGADHRLAFSEALWAGTISISAMAGAAVAALVAVPVPTGGALAESTPVRTRSDLHRA